jgi:hypothetical protein
VSVQNVNSTNVRNRSLSRDTQHTCCTHRHTHDDSGWWTVKNDHVARAQARQEATAAGEGASSGYPTGSESQARASLASVHANGTKAQQAGVRKRVAAQHPQIGQSLPQSFAGPGTVSPSVVDR